MKETDEFFKNLHRALEASGANELSEEEQKKVIGKLLTDGIPEIPFEDLSDEDKAIEMVGDAILEKKDTKFKEGIGHALMFNKSCEQAYEALGDREDDSNISIAFYKMGMDIGLGKYLTTEDGDKKVPVGMFYGYFETRSTMRCMYQYAECLFAREDNVEAMDVYEEIVRLNESDNMGARFVLLHLCIRNDEKEKFKKYVELFKDDCSCQVLYAQALFAFKYQKDSVKELNKVKKLALEANKHVPKVFEIGEESDAYQSYYTPGGEDEAEMYFDYFEEFWDDVEGATDWMISWN